MDGRDLEPVSPRILQVRRFSTLAEGLRSAAPEPFVVPDVFADFTGAHEPEQILATLSGHERPLFGYDREGAIVETTADVVIADWRRDTLAINIIDAPLPELKAIVPSTTLHLLGTDSVSPVLTRAGSYTPLHMDPPTYGGGWMFLAAGTKRWLLVDPTCLDALYDPERGRVRDLPTDELVRVAPPEALRQTLLGPGDFLFFPPGWMHRVQTLHHAVGVAGYCLREQDRPAADRYAARITADGHFSLWTWA